MERSRIKSYISYRQIIVLEAKTLSYSRKLRQSESESSYIYIETAFRKIFPPLYTKFKVIVDGKGYEVQIDSHWRIWANRFWAKLPSFKKGDTIVISKNESNSFKITVNKK